MKVSKTLLMLVVVHWHIDGLVTTNAFFFSYVFLLSRFLGVSGLSSNGSYELCKAVVLLVIWRAADPA